MQFADFSLFSAEEGMVGCHTPKYTTQRLHVSCRRLLKTQYDSYLSCLTVSSYELFECLLYPATMHHKPQGNQKCLSLTHMICVRLR